MPPLDRFVTAQASTFATALAELQAGRKRTHWMWFIFPQLRGLGMSSMAHEYGIASLEEARAYLAHPVLGTRLRQCTEAVLSVERRSLNAIFGSPDDMKFWSSMTLFSLVDTDERNQFSVALDRYCDGIGDPRTLELLGIDRPSAEDE